MKRWTLIALLMLLVLPTFGAQAAPSVTIAPEAAGVPAAFAPLLVGTDDGDTDRRAEQFKSAYQTALAEDVRTRLPQQPPVVTAAIPPARERRGVRRIR